MRAFCCAGGLLTGIAAEDSAKQGLAQELAKLMRVAARTGLQRRIVRLACQGPRSNPVQQPSNRKLAAIPFAQACLTGIPPRYPWRFVQIAPSVPAGTCRQAD